jgi:HPr kinase/phosphorylase
MLVHASCAARGADAVLFLGPPGCGKSDLVLRLLDRGWHLVADDQTDIAPGQPPRPAPALAGMLEVRGLGLVAGLGAPPAGCVLRLAVELGPPERLPAPRLWIAAGVTLPCLTLDPAPASAVVKVEWALDAVLGRRTLAAGAFAS